MTITVEVQGLDDLRVALRKYGEKAEKAISTEVKKTAIEINSNVKKRILRGPKSGVTYHRIADEDGMMRVYAGSYSEFGPNKLVAVFKTDGKANLSAKHTSSAPGEAPATDTGFLASSIYFEQANKMQATIGSRLAYAYWLEYGTRKIKPRPSWTPETELGQVKLTERIRKALERLAP